MAECCVAFGVASAQTSFTQVKLRAGFEKRNGLGSDDQTCRQWDISQPTFTQPPSLQEVKKKKLPPRAKAENVKIDTGGNLDLVTIQIVSS